MDINQKLQAQRKQLGYTQEAIAEKLQVSRQTISNWETGKSLPDIYSLVALSDLYQLSLDDLIKGDLKMQKKLSRDTKSFENWFVTGSFIVTGLTLFLANFATHLDLRIRVILLIAQLLFGIYYAYRCLPWLKERQLEKQTQYQTTDKVIGGSEVLFGVTLFEVLVSLVVGILTLV
ncbi:helix-turn-helix domain-containing protein [Enterococcus sp. HY326]|uniref:helix-turn-helix domain-containing protein n=1 Tax=Enterococcus sp. HY326 TaxID=2971265 RepID=UPI00223F957D|nr:helix-turn-helix transcriptional regulator [Enterococcus sp. HY326]